jgi:hypothetical protein
MNEAVQAIHQHEKLVLVLEFLVNSQRVSATGIAKLGGRKGNYSMASAWR